MSVSSDQEVWVMHIYSLTGLEAGSPSSTGEQVGFLQGLSAWFVGGASSGVLMGSFLCVCPPVSLCVS